MLANQDGLEAFFHQLLAGPGNRIGAGIEGLGNPAVTPPFACCRGVSLQQDACFGQQPGRVFADMYQRVESLPLLIAELHHVPLHGTLFRSHDASPSLRSHRFGDSPQDQGRGALVAHRHSDVGPIATGLSRFGSCSGSVDCHQFGMRRLH